MNADWFPDEELTAGPEHLDAAYVANYDLKAANDPTGDIAALQRLGLGDPSTVLDLGAGTGSFALAVAPLCTRVVAVDVSPVMLEVLRERAEAAGIANIEVVHAGFLSYRHSGDAPDFVYSRNALHHLPDFWKAIALARIAAILRPGGVLLLRDLVYSFDPDEADTSIGQWLGNAPDDPRRGWTRSELATHVRDEHSTFDWLLQPMLERAGFSIESVEHGPSRTFSSYVCRRTMR